MKPTFTHLRAQAHQKLAMYHQAPQRYGTAFHLTPPATNVNHLPLLQFTSPKKVPHVVPLALERMLSASQDPYLLWHVAHGNRLPINHLVVEDGMAMEQERRTTGSHVSDVTIIEVKPQAKCTIVDTSLDHTIAIRRTVVVVHEGASLTYWALRADNIFMTEALEVHLVGRQANATINHVVINGGTSQADIQVNIIHAAPDTTSRVTARIAGHTQAQNIYRGKITVEANARGSNGYQHARALLLSPKAVVDVLPELAINTNDVKCSHGVTTLHLDDAALFYLRSRGIPEQSARQLALTGFFHEGLTIPASLTATLDQRIAAVHTI